MVSKSIEETNQIARSVLASLTPEAGTAAVIRLVGDLGSGKTTFVRALAHGLGVDATEVTSPTFVVMKSYRTTHNTWRRFIHIDAYRLSTTEDARILALDEALSDPHTIICIEWPEHLKVVVPQKTTTLLFTFIDETTRKIEVQ